MANRGLSPAAIAAYSSDRVDFYYLFEIRFSEILYYTSCPHDILAKGSDKSDHNYNSNGLIISNPKIVESLEIKPMTLSLVMTGASAALHVLTLTENYRNAEVYIHLYEVSTGETNQIFKGYIDSFKTDEDAKKGTSTVTWSIANHWKNWDAIEGRFISHANQIALFSNDLGLEYSSRGDTRSRPIWGVQRSYSAYMDYLGPGTKPSYNNRFPMPFYETGSEQPFKKRLPLLYGEGVTKGDKVFWDYSGDLSESYWVVYVLSEGECEELVDITLNDISFDDPEYAPYVNYTFHSGAAGQAADANLVGATLLYNEWTTAHRLDSICYCVIEYIYNPELWEVTDDLGIDPTFHLKGKIVLDTRTPILAYSKNNAIVLADYLTNTLYGKGIPSSELKGFDVGADMCDTIVTAYDDGTPHNIKLFEFNGYVDTDLSIKKNVTGILFTMRAYLPHINGKYSLIIEQMNETGTYNIDEKNTGGKIQVNEGSIGDLANHVTYDYLSDVVPGQSEQVIVESDDYLDEDKGRILKKSYTNKYENNYYRSTNRAKTLLKQLREQVEVNLALSNFGSLQLECGSIVNVSSELRGWIGKKFRVNEIKIQNISDIEFKLKEYESIVFDWDELPKSNITQNTTYKSPFNVNPPTDLVLTSGTAELYKNADGTIVSRIHVTFNAPIETLIIGYIVYVEKTGEPEYLYQAINDVANTDLYIEPVEDGAQYLVSVSAINSLGIESDRINGFEIVEGKTLPPLPITNINTGSVDINVVNLQWTPENIEVDFKHYELWASLTNVFASAAILATSTSNVFNHGTSNPIYYWVRTVDTTGNKSEFYPATSTGILGTPDGSTDVDWDTLAGKPADSVIFNTVNFGNYFELDDYGLWTAPVGNTITQVLDNYSGDFAGLFECTLSAPASTGKDCTYIEIPERIALAFAGKQIRIVVYAKKPSTNASASFAMSYSAWGDDNSGWSEYFVPPENGSKFATFGFNYYVPLNLSGFTQDYLTIWGDTSGGGGGVLIDNVVIDIIGSWSEIYDDDDKKPADNADVTQYDDIRVSNSSEYSDLLTISNPAGGRFKGAPFETGAIVITLPQSWTSTMMRFIVDVYLYKDTANQNSGSFSITIGGYNWDSGNWQREFAQIHGDITSNNKVRFGHDGTKCVIIIGDETDIWDYPTIVVKSFQASFSNYTLDQWKDGWAVDVELIENHATKTFTWSHSFSDALLDAREVIGQGALAKVDAINYADDLLLFGQKPPPGADETNFIDSGVLTVRNPAGARFTAFGNHTGSIVIVLPQSWSDTMMKFVVDVYVHANSGEENKSISFSVAVGGYNNDTSNDWDVPFAQIFGNTSANNQVRFGHDPALDKCVICIGIDINLWVLPQISVRDFQASYVNYELEKWVDGWDVKIVPDTAPYTITDTITDALLDAYKILDQGTLATKDDADFDADVTGITKPANYADVSTPVQIGTKINYSSFGVPSLAGATYFHGFDINGDPADVPPIISFNGLKKTLSNDISLPNTTYRGYIVWRSSGFPDGNDYAIGHPTEVGTFEWTLYFGGTPTGITLTINDIIIGVSENDTNSHVEYSSVWGYGVPANATVDLNADITDYDDYRVSNISDNSDVLTVSRPDGGQKGYIGTINGAIVIHLPQSWTNTMLKFVIDVFVYAVGESFSLAIGGYNELSSTSWQKEFAQLSGNIASNNRVRFGHDGDNCCIVIGDEGGSWVFPHIEVNNLQAGYNNHTAAKWATGWSVSIEPSLTGYNFVGGSDFSDTLIDALSIKGQGALALKNSIAYNDDNLLTGTKPPWNADVTDYYDYKVTNLERYEGVVSISNPGGGRYGYPGNITGAIVIHLPQSWTSTMLKFVVDVYLHSTVLVDGVYKSKSFSVSVGGYTDNQANEWTHEFAQLSGNSESNNRVRFGHDGSKCCIVIGDEDDYLPFPQISVESFRAGAYNYLLSEWEKNWDVTIEPNLTGYNFSGGADFSDTLLDALSVKGQGTLATKDSVDYDTDEVTGTKPPANANVSTAVRIGVQINKYVFDGPTVNGDAYFHGFDANGDAADVNPEIGLNGNNLELDSDTLDPGIICAGYVVYRDLGWGGTGDKYAIGVPNGAASLEWTMYYGGAKFLTAGMTVDDVVIGFGRTNTDDTTINNISLWGYGIKANMALDYYADITNYNDTRISNSMVWEDYRVSNSIEANNVLTIRDPSGTTCPYANNGNPITGAIIITLPQGWTATMLRFAIDIYVHESAKQFSVLIGGYNGSSAWTNEFAQILGNTESSNRVRFGYNGTRCVVVIGNSTDGWRFPIIKVRDFQAGYNNFDLTQWDDNWAISIGNVESGYTWSGEILDALLDAYSIVGQGVLATEDEVDRYYNASYFYQNYFTATESLDLNAGCWSLVYGENLKLLQCTNLLYFDKVTRWKMTVTSDGYDLENQEWTGIHIGGTVQTGFVFIGNAGGTNGNLYSYVWNDDTEYKTLMISNTNGLEINLECVVNPGVNIIFKANSASYTFTTNPIESNAPLGGHVLFAQIGIDFTDHISLELGPYFFSRDE